MREARVDQAAPLRLAAREPRTEPQALAARLRAAARVAAPVPLVSAEAVMVVLVAGAHV